LLIFIVALGLMFFLVVRSVQVKMIRSPEKPKWRDQFKRLEHKMSHWYPLGSEGESEYFRIDHGQDYFAFFRRLGSVHVAGVLSGARLVGDCIGVLREVPLNRFTNSTKPILSKVWYICDLKLKKEYRGKRASLDLFLMARSHLQICNRFLHQHY
jgi:hypothetical protein